MKNSVILNCFFLLILVSVSLNGAQADQLISHYKKFEPKSCGDGRTKSNGYQVQEVAESDTRYGLKESLDQGQFGTCYGFSTYYLLQYFFSKYVNSRDRLSILDVLGQGCNREFREGGWQAATLFNIREDEGLGLFTGTEPIEYEKMFKNLKKLESYGGKNTSESCQDCCSFVGGSLLSSNVRKNLSDVQLLNHIVKEAGSSDNETFPFRLLDRLRGGPKTKIPHFNISVTSAPNSKAAILQMREHFSGNDPGPVGLEFCPESRGGKCEGGNHAVVITGVRKSCCGTQCHEEWHLVNSYGENSNSQGWMMAESLTSKVDGGSLNITSMAKCSDKKEALLPSCQEFFDTNENFSMLSITGNVNKMRSYLKKNKTPDLGRGLAYSVEADYRDMLKFFVHEKGVGTDYKLSGKTPLFYAVERGKKNSVEIFLQDGSDPTKPVYQGKSPLDLAKEKIKERGNGKIYEPIIAAIEQKLNQTRSLEKGLEKQASLLRQKQLSLNARDSQGFTQLMRAVRAGDLNSIEALLDQDVDVNVQNYLNETALSYAASKGQLKVVEMLLNASAEKEKPNIQGKTPLQVAVEGNHPDVVKLLLKSGANSSITTANGETLAHLAAGIGAIDCLKILQERKFNLEAEDKNGLTPLAVAATYGQKDAVAKLLEYGANPQHVSKNGKSAAEFIRKANRNDMIDFIDDKILSIAERKFSKERAILNTPDSKGKTALTLAVESGGSGRVAEIKALLSRGANPNIADLAGQVPLHWAAKKGDVEVIQLLIDAQADQFRRKADTGKPDNLNRSPLFFAASYGQAEAVKLLLKNGGLVDDPNHSRPLLIETIESDRKTAGPTLVALIHGGADPRRQYSGKTILAYAREIGSEGLADIMAKELENRRIHDAKIKDTAGLNLEQAIEKNKTQSVSELLKLGVNKDGVLTAGHSPLSWAIKKKKGDIVSLLLKEKADANLPNIVGTPPLSLAASIGDVGMTQSLIQAGANLNAKDEFGRSALQTAIIAGNDDVAKLLIKQGAQLNVLDKHGNSLLALALLNGNIGVIQLFLSQGQPQLKVNYEGKSLIDLARESGEQDIINLIEKGMKTW